MQAAHTGHRPILVLGGSGQIGSELLRRLASDSPVIAPARAALDLTDLAAVSKYIAAERPRLVYNAAAFTAVDLAEREVAASRRLNAELPGVIGEAAARVGAGVMHYSTDYVFDGASSTPYSETDTPAPLNEYGRSKLDGEQALLSAQPAAVVLRTTWVYGASGVNFALTVRRKLAEGASMRVVADQHGAPTWSRAIADATVRIANQLGDDTAQWRGRGGIYHLSAGGETTWFEFAQSLARIFHGSEGPSRITPISTAEFPTAAQRPRYSLLSNARVAQVFGVELPTWTEQLASAFGTANDGNG